MRYVCVKGYRIKGFLSEEIWIAEKEKDCWDLLEQICQLRQTGQLDTTLRDLCHQTSWHALAAENRWPSDSLPHVSVKQASFSRKVYIMQLCITTRAAEQMKCDKMLRQASGPRASQA